MNSRSPDLTLEIALSRLASSGRLLHFSIIKTDTGYQANMKRDDGGWNAQVRRTAVEAAWAAIAPPASVSWEDYYADDSDGLI